MYASVTKVDTLTINLLIFWLLFYSYDIIQQFDIFPVEVNLLMSIFVKFAKLGTFLYGASYLCI